MERARPSGLNDGRKPWNAHPFARDGSTHGPVGDRLTGPLASPREAEYCRASAEDMGLFPDLARESIGSLAP